MQAGLFICDHVGDQYQKKHGDYTDMFARLFPSFQWKYYDVINGQLPADLNECKVYMATGSRHSVYENINWINKMKKIIRELAAADKYFIGFCFGHQLLGEALGGKVEKSPNGWSAGVQEFSITEKRNWMMPFKNNLNLLMMCQDQVVQLPPGGRVLASSTKCPVGILQVGNKMLGIQAHPEFTREYDRLLMELREERMGPAVVTNGIKSLEKEIHPKLIRDWVINFIGQGGD